MKPRWRRLLLVALIALTSSAKAQKSGHEPIIDMHLHPGRGDELRVASSPGVSVDEAFRRAVMAQMDEYNVVLAVGSGSIEYITMWRDAAPGRLLVGPLFPCPDGRMPNGGPQCFTSGAVMPDITWLRNEYRAGHFRVMGELTTSYAGISPADSVMDPYFALAAEMDIPVAVHTGTGPPPSMRRGCCPKYNGSYGNPALLERVLQRYPKLRVQLMHAGEPFRDATIALMKAHRTVYLDFSALDLFAFRPFMYQYMQQLIAAGLGDRIMFGTDYSLRMADHVAFIEDAPFLSAQQKRDIFYNNAARFLRLPASEIARHHAVPAN